MGMQLRSWWQKNKKPLIIAAVVIIVLLIVFVLAVQRFGWDWTGFTSVTGPTLQPNEQYRPVRTLWDVLQLLIVPIILAVGGFWLNQIQKDREQRATEERAENERRAAEQRAKTEREIASDNQREAALQAYFDKMSELLLEKHLRDSPPEDEVRKIARVRTMTVLPRLGSVRQKSLLQFLHESSLIKKGESIIALNGAYLHGADLHRVGLYEADLHGVDLSKANLHKANLNGANLNGANLNGADLREAHLIGADLSEANFSGADITPEQLAQAKSLKGATMPDGKIHP